MGENPPYKMLGAGFVCSNFVINELCKGAKFYRTEKDKSF